MTADASVRRTETLIEGFGTRNLLRTAGGKWMKQAADVIEKVKGRN